MWNTFIRDRWMVLNGEYKIGCSSLRRHITQIPFRFSLFNEPSSFSISFFLFEERWISFVWLKRVDLISVSNTSFSTLFVLLSSALHTDTMLTISFYEVIWKLSQSNDLSDWCVFASSFTFVISSVSNGINHFRLIAWKLFWFHKS